MEQLREIIKHELNSINFSKWVSKTRKIYKEYIYLMEIQLKKIKDKNEK